MGDGTLGEPEAGAADAAFLGLEVTGDGTARFALTPFLARPDGKLYGGTGLAASIAVAEQATGRRALWTTVQFVSGAASVGDVIECAVDVRAHGKRTSQVRVTGRTGGAVLFDALGATASGGGDQAPLAFARPPDVPGPDGCEPFLVVPPAYRDVFKGELAGRMDIRVARRTTADGAPALALWVRVPGVVVTPAVLGFLADWVPAAIASAMGRFGGGTSLDNTLRLGEPADTDWVLLDLDPHLARAGYGHGAGLLWSPDGRLLGIASQTATLRFVD